MTTIPTDATEGGMSNASVKSFVERIERLEEERRDIGGDIRDVYAEVKSAGLNPKALRRVIAERRLKDRDQLFSDMDTYRSALGEAVEMVREGLSLRKASQKTGVSKSSIHRALAVPDVSQQHALQEAAMQRAADTSQEYDLTIPAHLDRRTA